MATGSPSQLPAGPAPRAFRNGVLLKNERRTWHHTYPLEMRQSRFEVLWGEKALDPGQPAEPRRSEDNAHTEDVCGRTIVQTRGWRQPREAQAGTCQPRLHSLSLAGEPAPSRATAQPYSSRPETIPTCFCAPSGREKGGFHFPRHDDSCPPPPGGRPVLLRVHGPVTCFPGQEER